MGAQSNDDDVVQAMHRAAIRSLTEAESFRAGAGAVLRAVCSHLDWAGGEYWEAGTDRGNVDRLAFWYSAELTGSALAEPGKLRLALAAGLPGEGWTSDSGLWIGDVAAEPGDLHRAALARESGLNTAITVPVTAQGHPGKLLFLTQDLAGASAELRLALESVGALVGQFADRCRSNDELHEERRRTNKPSPALTAPELTEPEHPLRDAVDLTGRRALVVEGDDTDRRILRVQLEAWGMACTAVASARGALTVLGEGFDIAVLDLHLPETDGVQLAEQIRRMPIGEHLPLLLLTSLAAKPHGSQADLFAGVHTKPIRAEVLRLMLSRILAPRGPDTPIPKVDDDVPAATSLRVLLAEDNVVNQQVAERLLVNLGHLVDIAADGRQAVDAVLSTDYDVVLMDLKMPNMDGLDATRAIRSMLPSPRQPQIVAMAASSLPADRLACLDAGMNGYLLKPVRLADLVESLHALPVSAPRPPSTPSVVPAAAGDPEVLTQLTADGGATSLESRRTLIEAYLEQADAWIPELAAAARNGDAERVRTLTHSLGSSSALLGAQPLAELLAEAGRVAQAEHEDLVPSVSAAEDEYRVMSMVLHANHDALAVTEVNEAAGD